MVPTEDAVATTTTTRKLKNQKEEIRRVERQSGTKRRSLALLLRMTKNLSDSSMKEKSHRRNTKRRLRFFRMALQLPTELQMQLCHRVYELNCDYIPNMLALSAFKKLATDLRPPFLSFPPASVSLFLMMGIMLLGIVLVLLYLCELL